MTQHCAVGVASPDHAPPPVEVTCILCQETAGDVAAQAKLFVQAVHVQRSAVLRTSSSSSPPLNLGSGASVCDCLLHATSVLFVCVCYNYLYTVHVCSRYVCVLAVYQHLSSFRFSAVKLDTLNAGANFSVGMYTSGCGHQMHALCWTRYIYILQHHKIRV